jgi:hypothetical protein
MKLKTRLSKTPELSEELVEKKLQEEMAELRRLREIVWQAENNRVLSEVDRLG